MQERMPTSYANVMKLTSRSNLSGEALYRVTMDTVLSYQLNYDMTFPELNYVPMLVQYAKELCLPGMFKQLGVDAFEGG